MKDRIEVKLNATAGHSYPRYKQYKLLFGPSVSLSVVLSLVVRNKMLDMARNKPTLIIAPFKLGK